MTKTTGDIVFELPGGIKMELVPLRRRDAGRVFHTILAKAVSILAAAAGEKDSDKQIPAIAAAVAQIPFDDLWTVAELLCQQAVVNGDEIKTLEDVDALAENPTLLYMIIYHGVKGNWPRLFFDLRAKLAGFAPDLLAKMKSTAGVVD
jgi:hypothetical protein